MFVILGGTGHVGSAAARRLVEQGLPVTVVTTSAEKAEGLKAQGMVPAVADVRDVDALRKVFRIGKRAFLLNPPAAIDKDTDAEERAGVRAILSALEGSGLEKVVAESTYGAQPGEACGDLSVLYELEQGLKAQPIPAAINRAAYYFSNFDMMVDPVRETGMLRTPFPADLTLPMAAPADLGAAAARRLMTGLDDVGLHYVEGPKRYTMSDVAQAFEAALGRPVQVETRPQKDWIADYRAQGFSQAAAESYAKMTRVSVEGGFQIPEDFERGPTTLETYIRDLVSRANP